MRPCTWTIPFLIRATLVTAAAWLLSACDDPTAAPSATQSAAPTIASTVPAATDLIIGIGARDRLVAVCSYDNNRSDVGSLPKAGDYQTIDWEVLRSVHPAVLVTEMAADRQPAGFTANAAELHIVPLNLTIERLDDIFTAVDQLGIALKEPNLSQTAHQQLLTRLQAIRNRVAEQKPLRTLIVTDTAADAVAGPGTYLDDLLQIAGGMNALPPGQGHWPSIDREKLLALNPDAILQLLPDASPQERQQAAAIWKQLPQIPAVANGRVYPIYAGYALSPGWHVTDLAETFAGDLHP